MTDSTVYFGTSFSSAPMERRSMRELMERIRTDGVLREHVARLRRVKALDKTVYAEMKKGLPWFCCGEFEEGIRRTDRFIRIETMVLDFDGMDGDTAAEDMVEKLSNDPRIHAAFVSPSGIGVKAVFRLDRPMENPKRYADFYRGFATAFSAEYGLENHCDLSTSDVSRVCFLSSDPKAVYRPDSMALRVPTPEAGFFGTEAADDNADTEETEPAKNGHPDADALKAIKARLAQHPPREVPPTDYFVPDAVYDVLPLIATALEGYGMQIAEHDDIQYGVKIRVEPAERPVSAWLNLYYGKKGYSVVGVPKKGGHPELTDMAKKVIWQALYATGMEAEQMRGESTDGAAILPIMRNEEYGQG